MRKHTSVAVVVVVHFCLALLSARTCAEFNAHVMCVRCADTGYAIMRNICDAVARKGKKKINNQQTKYIIHLICISYTIYYTFAVSFSHSLPPSWPMYPHEGIKQMAIFIKLINRAFRHSFILSILLSRLRLLIDDNTTILIRVFPNEYPESGLKGGNDLIRLWKCIL